MTIDFSTISFSDECRDPLDKCESVKGGFSPMEAKGDLLWWMAEQQYEFVIPSPHHHT